MPQPSITKITWKITYLKFDSNIQRANELMNSMHHYFTGSLTNPKCLTQGDHSPHLLQSITMDLQVSLAVHSLTDCLRTLFRDVSICQCFVDAFDGSMPNFKWGYYCIHWWHTSLPLLNHWYRMTNMSWRSSVLNIESQSHSIPLLGFGSLPWWVLTKLIVA